MTILLRKLYMFDKIEMENCHFKQYNKLLKEKHLTFLYVCIKVSIIFLCII